MYRLLILISVLLLASCEPAQQCDVSRPPVPRDLPAPEVGTYQVMIVVVGTREELFKMCGNLRPDLQACAYPNVQGKTATLILQANNWQDYAKHEMAHALLGHWHN